MVRAAKKPKAFGKLFQYKRLRQGMRARFSEETCIQSLLLGNPEEV